MIAARAVPVLLMLLAMPAAWAQEAKVRASLADAGDAWVGQRVTLVVELLAPGYFASAAHFSIPDPAGVLLMPPQSHPLVSRETIDGIAYTVQRHELPAWPMRAGAQSLPAVTVSFRYKRNPLDKETVEASVTTGAVALPVSMPPGAGNLGTVISARKLAMTESWDPLPGDGDVPAGSAFTRTVTFSAPDVPGMVFPPFPAGDIDGLGIYSKQHVEDHEERGAFAGLRRDVITYVLQKPGQYEIPAATLTWFDLDSKTLQTTRLPPRTLNVVVNPAMSAPSGPVVDAVTSRVYLSLLVAAMSGALLYVLSRSPRVRRRAAAAITRYRPVHLVPLNPSPRT